MRLRRWWLAIVTLLLVGCAGAGSTGPPRTAAAASDDALAGDLTVFAAASLTEAFQEIGDAFTRDHPDVRIVFNFAGSQQLATQILEGAPADVFAAANSTQMEVVTAAGLASSPEVFAGNALAIAVEAGNPEGVTGLSDLAREDLRVVLAAEEVPAGRYARQALDAAGVSVDPVSLETDVRAVLAKIRLGEADAGIVYASDVVAAGASVGRVPIPARHNVEAAYQVATIGDVPNGRVADAFVRYLRGRTAQRVLSSSGFCAP